MCTSVHLCVGVGECVCVCVRLMQMRCTGYVEGCLPLISLSHTLEHILCAPHLDQSEGKATAQQKTHLLANLYYASCAYEHVVNRL